MPEEAEVGTDKLDEQVHEELEREGSRLLKNFREFHTARRTIEGYEAMHMIRKGQVRWIGGDDVRRQNHFIDQLFDLAARDRAAQFLAGTPPSSFSKLQHFPLKSCIRLHKTALAPLIEAA
jgi:hypothetical protein